MASKNDLFEFIKTVVYAVLVCCLFTSGGYGIGAIYVAINDNSEVIEENTRLNNIISVQESEIESLYEEIRSLKIDLFQSQTKNIQKITNEDFLYLLENYDYTLSRFDYITEELSSIKFSLEDAITEDDRDYVYFEMEELQNKIYEFEDEAKEVVKEYI